MATAHPRGTRSGERNLDLVLWGATGYTGRLVARYLVERLAGSRTTPGDEPLAWALAGRDRSKLEALRNELVELSEAARELPLIVADALDPETLTPMVRRTKVVCTTVGPYSRYGTPLVRLCAEHGTHSCDLSGEVPWMRETVDRFHQPAAESGARIVHCCGFDSIPSDLGALVTHRALLEHGSRLRRGRLRVGSTRGKLSGGTLASMFEMIERARGDRRVRRTLADPYALAPPGAREGPDRNERLRPCFDEDRRRWTGPFLMAGINTRVVRRSNALLGFPYGPDFRYDEAVDTGAGLGGRLRAGALSAALGAFTTAAALPPTAWLLRTFVLPSPGEGPSAEQRARGRFRMTLIGEGPEEEPGRAETRIACDLDPGYGATARMLAESALCLARNETDGLDGGILTPASALGLPLVERLREAGVTIEPTVTGGRPAS